MTGIKYFCGLGNSSFAVWDSEVLGFTECFQWLCLTSVTHGIFSIGSAYYLGSSKRQHLGKVSQLAFILLVLSYLHALSVLIEVILAYTLEISHPPAYILSEALKFSAWLIHIILCHNSLRITRSVQKQNFSTMFYFVPLMGSTCINLYSTFKFHKSFKYKEELNFEDFCLFIYCGLNVIFWFLVVILACQKPQFSSKGCRLSSLVAPSNRLMYDSDNEELGASESSALLNSTVKFYDSNSIGSAMERSIILGRGGEKKNWFSRLFLIWVKPLMVKGSRGHLTNAEDLFTLPHEQDTGRVKAVFRKYAAQEIIKVKKTNERSTLTGKRGKFSLLRVLHHGFGKFYYSLGILKFISSCLGFAGPILLNRLVTFMENKEEPLQNGYFYAGGLFLSALLCALLTVHYSYQVNIVGLQIRAALVSAVYEKTLSVSTMALSTFSSGQVINFMSTDTDRVTNFINSFHEFWSLPFQIGVTLYLLYREVQLAFLAGLAFAILLIPVNRYLAVKIGQLSKSMMNHKDERVKLMNECMYGIRIIKFYAWESIFGARIAALRKLELSSLKGRKYLDALCVYFWATTPIIISILTFTTYVVFFEGTLTAAKVFTSIALFNILIAPLNAFPWVINGLMEAWVSLKRIQEFISLPDTEVDNYYSKVLQEPNGPQLKVSEGNFRWRARVCEDGAVQKNVVLKDKNTATSPTKEQDTGEAVPFILRNINLTANKGQFIGVVGKVGSGKSALFAAILGEIERLSGQIAIPVDLHGFGFVAQEPWIQHMTVRDNILFGKPYRREKYERVISACALEEDFSVLPNGDMTEVGEQGLTLSGGQKARISLARAVYQNKEVYLLDDPLAAVDSHVASHLVTNCIEGVLQEKTRILCTHHTKYLSNADLIIVMKEGKLCAMGAPKDLLKREDLLSGLLEEKNDHKEQDESKQVGEDEEYVDVGLNKNVVLVKEEEREKGVIAFSVLKTYYIAIGAVLASSILGFLLLMQVSRNLSDWWLAYWISNERDHSTPAGNTSSSVNLFNKKSRIDGRTQYYLTVYGGIAVSNTVFTLFRAFLFAYGGIVAATKIHDNLLAAIFNAKVVFFDVTPIGRIMNRFSSDLYSVDDSLPFILNILLAQFFGVLGSIVITCYGVPWFAAVLVPLTVLYYCAQNYYRKTSRELKRLYSVTLSPIYEHFAETLVGLRTIRAFNETSRFFSENETKLTDNQRAKFAGIAAGQWLSLHLQMIGVAVVTVVSFMAVLEHSYNSIDPGLVGLAISYALSITGRLGGLVQSFTETEKEMVNVERTNQYIEGIKREEGGILMVDRFWPHNGGIFFRDISLVYREGLSPSLFGVSLYINPREKIGICGRTGSGKSSLFLVLFQMVPVTAGEVLIDGVNISHIPLTALRSRLAIIPQDPFLFTGSVRDNMDPTDEYPDSELWSVLERCQLDVAVRELGGLNADVGEKGANLSVGQRQLLCLARALLKRSKIICIDEATASVDWETDVVIQRTIKREFENSTVLTIAHRIETILDSDRVIVMDKGRVAEFAAPNSLIQNKKSVFHSLAKGAKRW